MHTVAISLVSLNAFSAADFFLAAEITIVSFLRFNYTF